MITLISRPQEELYENNPPIYGENPYYTSYWNAGGGQLPMNYVLSNDKFPLNTADSSFSISSVSSNLGQAQLTTSGAHGFVAKEWIEISGTANYDGIYQVLFVPTTVTIVINKAYIATDTGSLIKYYNNYTIDVKIYAGLPEYHSFNSEKPLQEIGVLSYTPDGNNEILVNVTPLVKDKMSTLLDNDQVSIPNDLNLWTAFYIEYRETYDEVISGDVDTFNGAYTEDTYDNCNDYSFALDNEDFTSTLSPWANGVGSGETWVYNSNTAEVALSYPSNRISKSLIQSYDYSKGVSYNIDFRIDTGGEPVEIGFYFDSPSFFFGQVPFFETISVSSYTNYSFSFVAAENYETITILVTYKGSTSTTVSLDFVRQSYDIENPCRAYLFSSYSTRQFKSVYGGNMGEYVINSNDEVFDNKFMTLFENPIVWDGLEYKLTTIITSSLFSSLSNSAWDYGYVFNASYVAYGDGNPIDEILNTGSDTNNTKVSNILLGRPTQRDNTINGLISAEFDGGDALQGDGTTYVVGAINATMVAVFKMTGIPASGIGCSVFMIGAINTPQFSINITANKLIEFRLFNGELTVYEQVLSDYMIDLDMWYSVTATFDRVNGILVMYVNGVFYKSYSFTGGGLAIASTGRPWLGFTAISGHNRFVGNIALTKFKTSLLDECEIYAESSSIYSLYNIGNGGLTLSQKRYTTDTDYTEVITNIANNDDGVYRIEVDTDNLTGIKHIDCKIDGNGICNLSETKRLIVIRNVMSLKSI
jgi:hypothetical protein